MLSVMIRFQPVMNNTEFNIQWRVNQLEEERFTGCLYRQFTGTWYWDMSDIRDAGQQLSQADIMEILAKVYDLNEREANPAAVAQQDAIAEQTLQPQAENETLDF